MTHTVQMVIHTDFVTTNHYLHKIISSHSIVPSGFGMGCCHVEFIPQEQIVSVKIIW